MKVSEYIRLVANIAVLKEVAKEYPGKIIEDIIALMEAKIKKTKIKANNMNDYYISYQAVKGLTLIGLGGILVHCSCGLEGIRQAVLEWHNTYCKHPDNIKADGIIITSLTVLDPTSAAQLASDTCNKIKIEDKGNNATKQ